MTDKKEFLLRKNKGRLEFDTYINALQEAGLNLGKPNFLTLEDSIEYFDRMKNISDKTSGKSFTGEDKEKCLEYIDSLLVQCRDNDNIFLWTKYSEYCGLSTIKIEELKSQHLINILDNKYFGGYCTIFSGGKGRKITFDLDEDYDEMNDYAWIYSVSLFSSSEL